MSVTAEGDVELSSWDATTGTLRPIAVYDGNDYTLGVFPIVVTPDGKGLWVGSNRHGDRTTLARLDVATGEETEVDSHPTFSVDPRAQVWPTLPSPVILSQRTGELLGVRYLGERQVIHTLDPDFAAVLANLEKLSDGDIAGISSDDSEQRWVVSFTHDRIPHVTYFYDHSTGESRVLFRPYPHLDPEALAPMTPVTITSRDGLDLHSYLTLPVGIEPKGLPLVLLVHGGPWARQLGLQPRSSASRQPRLCGAAGQLPRIHRVRQGLRQGRIGEFAGKMHDDLIHAVDWAVEQRYADRERVAIFGGSYGGYATLVGVTFTPNVFAAAIDYVGVSNLANFMRTLPPAARPHLANNWHLYVGNPDDPEQEADMLARSPITRVDQIRTPLLVIQGANDVRVVQAESDNLVEALRAAGSPSSTSSRTTRDTGSSTMRT